MTILRALILGGGDMGSAVAHQLFRRGSQVLICDRPQSPHARRGMAFTDALFEGRASLDGVEAEFLSDIPAVLACWERRHAVPIVTLPEGVLVSALRFDAIVDATMRRNREPADLRSLAPLSIGLGPGYLAGANCHVAIETQWGPSMGQVLRNGPAAGRSGGPHAIEGVTHERFAFAPAAGTWRTQAVLGQAVTAGERMGTLGEHEVLAPIAGFLRGISRDGSEVLAGHRVIEVDPRAQPQIFGLGERPLAVALGVVEAMQSLAASPAGTA